MLQATTAQSATEESQTIRDRFPFEPERVRLFISLSNILSFF